VIVGVPVAGGVVAGAAGRFGRGAHRVVPESSMHAARSIASWLGPDGALGPDGPPGLPLIWREFVPGSVLGRCCVPEIVRDEPSVEPQKPSSDVSGEQPASKVAGDEVKPSADETTMQNATFRFSMDSRPSLMRRRSREISCRP
jgi:hypothetical protein